MMPDRELAVVQTPGITPRRWTMFLNQLRKGQTIRAACAHAGFGRSTLYTMVNAPGNEDLIEQIDRAKDEGERRLVESVVNAAHTGETVTTPGGTVVVKPGDWRAGAWLLEHHPHTRERYAAISKQQIGGDPDNPVPIQQVNMTVVGDLSAAERRAQIITTLQRAGVMPIPDPENPVINVTPEEERDGG